MSRQIAMVRITISREKLKRNDFTADSEEVVDMVSKITEKEREKFLEPAAEFLFSAMKSAGLISATN